MKHFLRSAVFMLAVFSASFPVLAANTEVVSSHPVSQPQALADKSVNINTADAQTIVDAHIKGIGRKRAEAIVAYRGQHGPFKSVDDLKNIKGISEKLIDANRHRLMLE